MHTAVQRERFQLQGVPVGIISRHPGASGECKPDAAQR